MRTVEIRISARTTGSEYERFADLWDQNNNVDLKIDNMTVEETRSVVSLLISRRPCSLYESVLETLAERNGTPSDCLVKIFSTNIECCQMSVCLRDDLDDVLKGLCKKSRHRDVCEHYKMRQKWLKKEQGRQPNTKKQTL